MNRKGLTAVVDAMFFILIIGMAVSVISVVNPSGEGGGDDASETCDAIMMSNVSLSDFGFDDDGSVHPVADMVAASMMLGDGSAEGYLSRILDGLYPRGYDMEVDLSDGCGAEHSLDLSRGRGTASVEYSGTYAVTYGGTVEVHLSVY